MMASKMKIKSIEIKNIRGIRELKLIPNGSNVVIWGPNGSGKSAVVDAIDFLMTGDIHRLKGEGTAGASLAKHGPHIDFSEHPDQSFVRASILIDGVKGDAYISRSMKDPDNIVLEGVTLEQVSDALEMAGLRQHTLSRREILRYIASQAGKRSAEIQSLLNLSDLESIRLSINRVKKEAKNEVKSALSNVKSAEAAISACLSLDDYDLHKIKEKVNEQRQVLGSSTIEEIKSTTVKTALSPPQGSKYESSPNPQLLVQHNESIIRMLEEIKTFIDDNRDDLLADIELIHSDIHSGRKAESLTLLKIGRNLLDATGVCPLCGYEWEPSRLVQIITESIESAEEMKQTLDRIDKNVNIVSDSISKIRSRFEIIQSTAKQMNLTESIQYLSNQLKVLADYQDTCEKPLEKIADLQEYVITGFTLPDESKLKVFLDSILSKAKQLTPTLSPEQAAWDVLTALVAKLETYEKAKENQEAAELFSDRANTFVDAFFTIRDSELEKLYNMIKDRFIELYRFIHSEDESQFDAKLKPDGKFEVDFYNRGMHPPLALHSEGHQDSMGICLFLALSEYLTSGKLGVVVLDDVVMSVDSEHRRLFCRLLKKHFPGKQFFITTHDRTWARQLQIEGIVKGNNFVEFVRWNLKDGPSVLLEGDLWNRINSYLDDNDVPSASFQLRNGSERFFETACDNLKASVRYLSSARYTLSDYMNGAISALKRYYRQSKNAANSWGKSKLVIELTEQESVINQIISRTNIEKWGINPSVHYDNWHELSRGDFKPIIEAFHDCFNLFICNECGTTLRVNLQYEIHEAVRCDCQKINLNLVRK